MKVLVTGATGFVGQHVVPHALNRGHAVTVLARSAEAAKRFPWSSKVAVILGDTESVHSSQTSALADHDAAIHLAWPGLPNYGALSHYERALPVQYGFLRQLISSGVRQILVAGTCFEYGMQSGVMTEAMPTMPANAYAVAKDSLHKFLQQLRRESPFTLQWARLFYLHGPGQHANSLLGQLDRAIESGEKVFNMSPGDQLRDYLAVQDAAFRLARLLEHPVCDGPINICSGQPISVRKLAEDHIAVRGAQIRLNLGHYPYSPFEPLAFWGDKSKFDTLCGHE
jgi:dTDP-6-deoxy-L-talose 4-dehydrogenase (NAD+)